jgi:hypothetical protein
MGASALLPAAEIVGHKRSRQASALRQDLYTQTIGMSAQISNLIDLSSIGGGGAITFGDIQLFNGITPGQTVRQSPYIQPNGSQLGGFTFGAHEGSHTIVDDALGILALPLYLGSAAINGWWTNPYEQKADQHAKYGTSPFP